MARTVTQAELDRTLEALRTAGGNVVQAASQLGVHFKTVYLRLDKLGRKASEFKPAEGKAVGSNEEKRVAAEGLDRARGQRIRKTSAGRLSPAAGRVDTAGQDAGSDLAASLWSTFIAGGRSDVELRNVIAEHYLDVAREAAKVYAAKFRGLVSADELLGAATQGLLESIDRFQPERGYKFVTFSLPRVRGSIADYLRSIDHVPRLARGRYRSIEAARRDLYPLLGRNPTDAELAERTGLAEQTVVHDSAVAGQTQLSCVMVESDEAGGRDQSLEFFLADPRARRPNGRSRQRWFWDHVTASCSWDERVLLYLYYVKGKTMKQIAAVLDISESRVSQLHSQICQRLHAVLDRADAFERIA